VRSQLLEREREREEVIFEFSGENIIVFLLFFFFFF
jgi:hypothetical protein